jgi:hypothetical protein
VDLVAIIGASLNEVAGKITMRFVIRIMPHGSEFEEAEPPARLTDALLYIEHRATRCQFDGGRGDQE